MNNQEKLKIAIESILKERLIFCSNRAKRDLSEKGSMFFIQETKIIKEELYYRSTKSKYYPEGLISKNNLITLMEKHSKENPIIKNELIMIPVGKYMGHTTCRCCGVSLGNGYGDIVFEYDGNKYNLGLTGGADHYFKHNINLNLISYSWIDKEKGIKLHTQFVGDVKDIVLINEYIQILKPEVIQKKIKPKYD